MNLIYQSVTLRKKKNHLPYWHTVLSLDIEDRWIDVCSLISLLSPTSRKHSSTGWNYGKQIRECMLQKQTRKHY